MSNVSRAILAFVLLTLAAVTTAARACSGGFDNNVFPLGDADLLKAPTIDFAVELTRFGVTLRRPMSNVPDPHDVEADLRELRDALAATDATEPERARVVSEYAALRDAMRGDREKGAAIPNPPRQLPRGLPPEFDLYLRGAIAFERLESDEARESWTRLLNLPAKQRQRRTVWAAYMIGRTYAMGSVEGDAQSTIEWMRRTRDLATAGFADSQNLAGATWGWEARAMLDEGRFEQAFALYQKAGDAMSLVDTAQRAFKADAARMRELARDPLGRRVMTACAASGGGPWRPEIDEKALDAWLAALAAADAHDVGGADVIAWAAYQRGRVDQARLWLARIDQPTHLSRWLESKLLLRDGKVDQATRLLAELVEAWPVNDEWHVEWQSPIFPADRVVGELGALKLARGQFAEVMDLFLRSLFFDEAAYVAERVLTVEELKSYVDRNWPAGAPGPVSAKKPGIGDSAYGFRGLAPAEIPTAIRYLLARRLTRLGRWRDARPYYPAEMLATFDDYIGAVRGGHDPVLSRDERGESLWRAAQLARRQGMELMGTELEPDGRGSGSGGNAGSWRPRENVPSRVRDAAKNPITGPRPDESRRVLAHHPRPDRRFHYRYVAADHAWAAAQLLPDESDLKARVLCDAGNWIAPYDAPGADRYYKALVRDCGTTQLGRTARRIGWLP